MKKDKTVDFNRLMAKVRFVDTPLGGRYLMTFDGMREIFKDTGDVIPFVNKKGYRVILNGEEM